MEMAKRMLILRRRRVVSYIRNWDQHEFDLSTDPARREPFCRCWQRRKSSAPPDPNLIWRAAINLPPTDSPIPQPTMGHGILGMAVFGRGSKATPGWNSILALMPTTHGFVLVFHWSEFMGIHL